MPIMTISEARNLEGTVLVIDGDSLACQAVYALASKPEAYTLDIAKKRLVDNITKLGEDVTSANGQLINHVVLCLDGIANFRYGLFPEYKKDRGNKPAYLVELKEWLSKRYHVISDRQLESDDIVFAVAHQNKNAIVPLVDKDFLQIVCRIYYHPVRSKSLDTPTTPAIIKDNGIIEARRFLAMQCFTGDATDGFRFLHDLTGRAKFMLKAKKHSLEEACHDVAMLHWEDQLEQLAVKFDMTADYQTRWIKNRCMATLDNIVTSKGIKSEGGFELHMRGFPNKFDF